MQRITPGLALALTLTAFSAAEAQEEITSISFDEIPGGMTAVVGSPPIQLQADTEVAGDLNATGEVATGIGVRFPDGSLQVTASVGSGSPSGGYSNRIPDITPPNAYTEICFKAGAVQFDIHSAAEPTAGDDCLPGDVGWIIERFERESGASTSWNQAVAACLADGMRLPEPFEFQFTCGDAGLFAVTDMNDDWEWGSNLPIPINTSGSDGVGVALIGNGSCNRAGFGWIDRNSGPASVHRFRCAQ